MSKHLDLAKKLKALSEKGVGGEKINAEKMLSDLMKKHNLSIEDIEGEKKQDYFFRIKKGDERLWLQIVCRVNPEIKKYGEIPSKKIKELGLKGNYIITCTTSEYIEIESMLSVYKRLYKEELDLFFTAFCNANDLLVYVKNPKSVKDLNDEELEKYLRMKKLASSIKTETFRKQIEKQ